MITLLNAAPDTGNQGVSALCHSVVAGLARHGADQITVADHGRGLRRANWGYTDVSLVGLTHHRRFWRGDSLRTAHALGRVGGGFSAPARAIAGSRAVLDISGGDSFTDIYGARRFQAMALTKQMALQAGVPLILLPQKLGPFSDPDLEAEAQDILRRAKAVWVRDAQSFEYLKAALGTQFDPERHRLGVDVAIALPKTQAQDLPPQLAAWLSQDRSGPVAGLNISGLLCNEATQAQHQFGLAARHDDQADAMVRALLVADPTLKLVLIAHVHRPEGDMESDLAAAKALIARLGTIAEGRVCALPGARDAMALKGVIAQLDWFAGARMHATIGAFSSSVPTLGLGYTDKAKGVFEACGIGPEVADLRQLDPRALAARAVASYHNRAATRARLTQSVPKLRARADAEMAMIAAQAGL